MLERVSEALNNRAFLAKHLHEDICNPKSTYNKGFKDLRDKLNSACSEGTKSLSSDDTKSPPSNPEEEVIQALNHLCRTPPKVPREQYLSDALANRDKKAKKVKKGKEDKSFENSGAKEKLGSVWQERRYFIERALGDKWMWWKIEIERMKSTENNGK